MRASSARRQGARRGQVVVVTALMAAVLIGLAALAVDGGRGYLDRRNLQSAADLSALSGLTKFATTGATARLNSIPSARGAAINEAVLNLPGTSVPASYKLPSGSGLSSDFAGVSVGNSYTIDVAADFFTVTVTIHHSLPLALGPASAAVGLTAFTPAAKATAIDEQIPFALILFRPAPDGATGMNQYSNLVQNGGNATLNISAAAGSTGDTLSNMNVCPLPGNMVYAGGENYDVVVPNPSCASYTGNVSGTGSGLAFKTFPSALPDPRYPEPPAGTSCGALCNTSITVNNNKTLCLFPGTYSSITVKNGGKLILMPGVFRVTTGGFGDNGIVTDVQGTTGASFSGSGLQPADLNNAGGDNCPASVPSGDTGVTVDMAPVGSKGDQNQLSAATGAIFVLHPPTTGAHKNITVYVEEAANFDPCTWTNSGCGSAVVNFTSSGTAYFITGLVYGYSDNMVFSGGAGGSGLGQVFAWTMVLNGNNTVSETYDPALVPAIQGLEK